jgi:peptidyl-prolyl cis-trans isomerase D
MIRFLQSGNKAAKYILGGFLLILAGSMVTYLIPGFMSNADTTGSTGILATVDGEKIRTDDVSKMVQRQMKSQRVPDFYVPILMQQAMQRLVQQEEVRYAAARLGLQASDAEVRDELQNGAYKQFFYPGGKWIGQKEYVDFLAQNEMTPEFFENQVVRNDILGRKLYETIAAGVNVTPAEVEQDYKDKNLKVKFQYAILNLDDIQKEIKPTDADLKAFYEKNKPRYDNAIPEKRQLRYFVLLDKDAEGKATVTEAEVQRQYNDHLDQYRMPDRVRVRHILIRTPAAGPDGKTDAKAVDEARAKAQDVLKQVKAGGNFAELAKKYSQDPGSAEKGGELGWAQRGGFVPEFDKVAFSLNPGQISDLVQSPFGFHIIQGEEKEVARVKPLAELRDEIEKTLKAQKAGTVLDGQANLAQNTAAKQGLDKAAAQVGAHVLESNSVSRTDSLAGVGPAPDVMAAIFATADKAPQMQRFTQGYIVYQVTKVDPPRTPSLDEIKDRVTAEFKSQRASELLQKKVQEMAERAHTEHSLEKAAKAAGATVKTSELVGRTSQVPDLGAMGDPRAAGAAFSLKPGEISGPINLGQKAAVLQVSDRQDASVTDPQFARERDRIMEELSEHKRQLALELFLGNLNSRLEKEGKVKFNKTEMERLTKNRG